MEHFATAKQFIKEKFDGREKTAVFATIAVVSGFFMLGKYMKKRKLQQQLQEFEKESIESNKIILHAAPCWNFPTPHASPYVTKMIAFLEYNKIPYKFDTTMMMHYYTQKMPWITYKTHHQPDSNLIIKWISKQKDFNYINIDKHLNKKQLAICDAYKSMIEDGLIQVIGWRRWGDYENMNKYCDLIFEGMNPFMAKLIKMISVDKFKRAFWLNGIGRFKEEEIYAKGERLIESVVVTMGDNKFFFGDKLSTLDISIYGHFGGMYQLSSVLTWGVDKSLPAKLPFVKEMNEYMKRIEIECFGELKFWKDIV